MARKYKHPAKDLEFETNFVNGSAVTLTAEAANARNATIQLRDQGGGNLGDYAVFEAWLSDSNVGAGHAAAAPSGGVTAAAGTILYAPVAGKHFVLQADNTGKVTLTITEAAAKTFYLCVRHPDGKRTVTAVAFV